MPTEASLGESVAVHHDPRERLCLLRHAAGTINVSLARSMFDRALCTAAGSAEAEACVAQVEQVLGASSSLPPRKDRDWYTAALAALLRRVDRALLDAAQEGSAGLAALDAALRQLLATGGHLPLDIVRRSMQQIHPPPAGAGGASALVPSASRHAIRLFISGKIAAGCPALLDAFGVSHVITCFATGRGIDVGDRPGGRLVLPCVDDERYDLTKDFETALDFMTVAIAEYAAARKPPVVLIHCAAGMHRCTAIAAAIMIRLLRMPLQDALDAIKTARPMAQPTPNFMNQLEELAGAVCSSAGDA